MTSLEWIAPKYVRLPDFIICGAMKCGTSTVHELLGKHPDVFIPSQEVNFFDIDDIFQHSDFYFWHEDRWTWPNIADDPERYWRWYQSFFQNAPNDAVVGEDSTCYLPSSMAAYRIALQSKPIKAIICLRHPTQRAYSQYWHMVRTGRALYDFEDTIRFTPTYVIERSMYLTQIRDFMEHIPRERMFFFILEEFLADKESTIENLAEFLSLDFGSFPTGALETHSNKGMLPKSPKIQVLKNRMLRAVGNERYTARLPHCESMDEPVRGAVFSRQANKWHDRFNRTRSRRIPPMNPGTKEFLDKFFQRELKGLSDIVGSDLDKLWFQT